MGESHEEMLRHYEPGGLLPRIVAGLQALGKDLDSVTHEDLGRTFGTLGVDVHAVGPGVPGRVGHRLASGQDEGPGAVR